MKTRDELHRLAGIAALLAFATAGVGLLLGGHGVGRPASPRPAPSVRPIDAATAPSAPPAGPATPRVDAASSAPPKRTAPAPAEALASFAAAFRRQFRDADLAESARAALRAARGALPPAHPDALPLARTEAFLHSCLRARPAFSGVDWGELEARAGELAALPSCAPWGSDLLAWVHAERSAQALVDSAQRAPRGMSIEEFYTALREVPADSLYAAEAAAKRGVLREVLVERAFRGASERARLGDYRGGGEELAGLLALLGDDAAGVRPHLDPLRRECERHAPAQERLQEVEARLAEEDLAGVERALALLPADLPAPLAERARAAREEIPPRRRLAVARAHYRAGEGAEALRALEGEAHADAGALRSRIEAVLDLDRGARAAAARGHQNESILLWVDLLEREPDPDNAYRRAAAEQPLVRERCHAPAEVACDAGQRSLEAARWAEAREHLDEALRLFPHHPRARGMLDEFCREAERDFNSDVARFHKGELSLDFVLAKFEGVLGFLRPADGEVYDAYQGTYRRLRARRPEGK